MILEQIQLENNPMAISFLIVMLFIFFSGIALTFFNKSNKYSDYIGYVPAALTSIGILGTFTGIVIGLWSFDLTQIDQSIAQLLFGLKTAFITSIFGVFLSITFRLISYFLPKSEADTKNNNAQKSIDDLHQVLAQSLELQKENQQLFVKQYEQQQAYIAQNEKQIEQYKNYANDYSKTLSSQITNQLSSIVENFNDQLQTQFGENLSKYSNNFKIIESAFSNIEQQIDNQNKTLASQHEQIEVSHTLFEKFSTSIERINSNIEKLEQAQSVLIPIYDKQIEQTKLTEQANQSLSNTLAKIEEQVPNLGTHLHNLEQCVSLLSKDLTENLLQYQNDFKENCDKQNETFYSGIKQWTGSIEKTQVQFSNASQALESFIEQTQNIKTTSFEQIAETNIKIFKDSLQQSASMQVNLNESMMNDLSSQLQNYIADTQQYSQKQFKSIESLMQREMDLVFKQMGEALGSVSGQFTRDYQIIITQMQKVLSQNQELLK